MSLRPLLVLLASLLWFVFCHYWYCCKVKHACYGCAPKVESSTTAYPEGQAPLTFNWSDEKAVTTDAFADYKTNILAKNSNDNLLEIVGHYTKEETNTSSYENIGIARANKIRELFLADIPEERIRLSSKLVESTDDMRDNPFTSASFNWLTQEVEKSEVVEMSGKTLILFPYNSAQKKADPNVDQYLSQLAKKLATSGGKVSIIGHTDSQGSPESNLRLGRSRAQTIRSILLQKGVSSSQIRIESKGQSVPIATNDSEQGRHQNRRVEVILE